MDINALLVGYEPHTISFYSYSLLLLNTMSSSCAAGHIPVYINTMYSRVPT